MEKTFSCNKNVCFVGDSITYGANFTSHIYEYYKNEKPELKVKVFNVGVPGDTSTLCLNRLESDVNRYNPEEVVLMFGMNDVGRLDFGIEKPCKEILLSRENNIERYVNSMEKLVNYFLDKNIPVTVCSSTPYDEYSNAEEKNLFGINEYLLKGFNRLKERLNGKNIKLFVDFITPFEEILKGFTNKFNPLIELDRVHPTSYGHQLMAQIFLNAQGFNEKIPTLSQVENNLQLTKYVSDLKSRRFELERILRSISFIEYNAVYWNLKEDYKISDGEKVYGRDYMEVSEIIEFWKKYFSIASKVSPFWEETTSNFIKYKEKEQEVLKELVSITK